MGLKPYLPHPVTAMPKEPRAETGEPENTNSPHSFRELDLLSALVRQQLLQLFHGKKGRQHFNRAVDEQNVGDAGML